MAEGIFPSINLAQAIALGLITYFAIRSISSFFRPFAASGHRTGLTHNQPANTGRRVNPAHVETLAQMFPQLERRDIMWDLQRNGGNVAATTERVLSGRSLERPPPSFQPVIVEQASSRTAGASRAQTRPSSSVHPDLITRYNLSSKLDNADNIASSTAQAQSPATSAQRPGWSNNKSERQTLLQQRRDEMILAARRKMEEKDKASTRA